MTERVVAYTLRNRTKLELEQLEAYRRAESRVKLLLILMIATIIGIVAS